MYVGLACGCGCEGGGQRHRLRDTARQRTMQCVCGMCVLCGYACGVCGGQAETERHSQAKDNVHGWISLLICLCFLSSFITSVIKTTPMKCESATTNLHLSLGRQTGECSELAGGGRDVLSPGQL